MDPEDRIHYDFVRLDADEAADLGLSGPVFIVHGGSGIWANHEDIPRLTSVLRAAHGGPDEG